MRDDRNARRVEGISRVRAECERRGWAGRRARRRVRSLGRRSGRSCRRLLRPRVPWRRAFFLLSRRLNWLPKNLTRTAALGCDLLVSAAKAGQARVPVLPNVDCQWCGFGGNSGALHALLKALRLHPLGGKRLRVKVQRKRRAGSRKTRDQVCGHAAGGRGIRVLPEAGAAAFPKSCRLDDSPETLSVKVEPALHAAC